MIHKKNKSKINTSKMSLNAHLYNNVSRKTNNKTGRKKIKNKVATEAFVSHD